MNNKYSGIQTMIQGELLFTQPQTLFMNVGSLLDSHSNSRKQLLLRGTSVFQSVCIT